MSENDQPHLPPPSLWPIGFAVGVACVLTGIVVSPIVAVVGAVIALAFGFLWLRDVTKPVRTPAPAVEPEQRETYVAITPPEDDEPETYPRSTFLSAATLGLGAVIGGLITIPVLGFAVLPSFTNQDEQDVVLGPIDEFPEGEFVIATYMEDPEVGSWAIVSNPGMPFGVTLVAGSSPPSSRSRRATSDRARTPAPGADSGPARSSR